MKKINKIKKIKKTSKVFFKTVDTNIMNSKRIINIKNEREIKNEKINYLFNDDLFYVYVFNFHQIFIVNNLLSIVVKINHNQLDSIESKERKKMRLEKRYISFKEMKKHLTSNKADTLTFAVDQMLLKAHTLTELFDEINALKAVKFETNKDFKNLAIIKKHIRYRQTHNRIVFTKNKKDQVRMIALDYKAENSQEKLF